MTRCLLGVLKSKINVFRLYRFPSDVREETYYKIMSQREKRISGSNGSKNNVSNLLFVFFKVQKPPNKTRFLTGVKNDSWAIVG